AVLVAALETLAEVIRVLVVADVVAVVAVACVAVAVAAAHVIAPAVLAVGPPRVEALPVAALHGLAHQFGAVAVGLVPAAAVGIAVAGRRPVVRVAVVVPAGAAPATLLLAQAGLVLALVAVLGHASLLLQCARALGAAAFGQLALAFALAVELFRAPAFGLDAGLRLSALDAAAVLRLAPADFPVVAALDAGGLRAGGLRTRLRGPLHALARRRVAGGLPGRGRRGPARGTRCLARFACGGLRRRTRGGRGGRVGSGLDAHSRIPARLLAAGGALA